MSLRQNCAGVVHFNIEKNAEIGKNRPAGKAKILVLSGYLHIIMGFLKSLQVLVLNLGRSNENMLCLAMDYIYGIFLYVGEYIAYYISRFLLIRMKKSEVRK